jgi:hypothetical protein
VYFGRLTVNWICFEEKIGFLDWEKAKREVKVFYEKMLELQRMYVIELQAAKPRRELHHGWMATRMPHRIWQNSHHRAIRFLAWEVNSISRSHADSSSHTSLLFSTIFAVRKVSIIGVRNKKF